MINDVINSMKLIENLFDCKKYLICDGYKIIPKNENQWKKGQIE